MKNNLIIADDENDYDTIQEKYIKYLNKTNYFDGNGDDCFYSKRLEDSEFEQLLDTQYYMFRK